MTVISGRYMSEHGRTGLMEEKKNGTRKSVCIIVKDALFRKVTL